MPPRLRLGNQTAFSAATAAEPWGFALSHGFLAFEWFADQKVDAEGRVHGWTFSDDDPAIRAAKRELGRTRGLWQTVHAPWQANLLEPDGAPHVRESLAYARDIGAELVNIHLYSEAGPAAFFAALKPLAMSARELGLRLSLENTPETSPRDFNQVFALIAADPELRGILGLCLDIGHANLCLATRNDYIRFIDELSADVPIIHLHVHENWGDADRHLPLFTGPARENDSGVRLFLDRLRKRNYRGALILEQWPQPPELLLAAADRLRRLLTELWPAALAEEVPPVPAIAAGEAPQAAGVSSASAAQTIVAPASSPSGKSPNGVKRGEFIFSGPAGSAGLAGISLPSSSTRKDGAAEAGGPGAGNPEPTARALVELNSRHTSWRLRLEGVRDLLLAEDFSPTAAGLGYVAVYLRFLATGELVCAEEGGHHRPCHHAAAAREIENFLARLETPELAWLARRISPALPSFAAEFSRAEPLTRIRDLAHRNDIPKELKLRIKTTLQNKLHRSADPGDLAVSAAILADICAPGANCPAEFVAQFRVFHAELEEFFSAASLGRRLAQLEAAADCPAELRQAAANFRAARAGAETSALARSALLKLTELRRQLATAPVGDPAGRQSLRLLDIALEDDAFVLLGTSLAAAAGGRNESPSSSRLLVWPDFLELVQAALINARLAQIEPEESAAVAAELAAWVRELKPESRLDLLRLRASLERIRRLAEKHSTWLMQELAPLAESLGAALGVSEAARRLFGEGLARGGLAFPLAGLADLGLGEIGKVLNLPPWEAVSPGRAGGYCRRARTLGELRNEPGPIVALVETAEGDEELSPNLTGIVLGRALPHLSHLGVRVRQAGVPLAACAEDGARGAAEFARLAALSSRPVEIQVSADGLRLHETERVESAAARGATRKTERNLPAADLHSAGRMIPLIKAQAGFAGAKAAASARLRTLAGDSPAEPFTAPGGAVVPFGSLEACLAQAGRMADYEKLLAQLPSATETDFLILADELRALVEVLCPPEAWLAELRALLPAGRQYAVRSSANGEDLADLAGAGLYESVLGVVASELGPAVARVWASLWSRRAALSRRDCGLPAGGVSMAVLIQELVEPEYSFIMHTRDPLAPDAARASVELAAGLGEILAGAGVAGAPYRLNAEHSGAAATIERFASFSLAWRPGAAGGPTRQRVDYSRETLSAEPNALAEAGKRLGRLAGWLETRLGAAQDVEGVLSGGRIWLVQARPQQGLQTSG